MFQCICLKLYDGCIPSQGITRSAKTKTSWLHFSHTFHLTGIKCDVVMKQFKSKILILVTFEWRISERGEIAAHVCMHSDISGSVWFILC